jgi:MFS family permease
VASAATAALALPTPTLARMVLLGLLGIGLGVYIPANNAAIMAKVPAEQAARAGGLINMTRGLGTAIGVALVALCLHVTDLAHRRGLYPPLTAAVLTVGALLAVVAGHATDASAHHRGGTDLDLAETEYADPP